MNYLSMYFPGFCQFDLCDNHMSWLGGKGRPISRVFIYFFLVCSLIFNTIYSHIEIIMNDVKLGLDYLRLLRADKCMNMKETLQHSHCLNPRFRELQQSIAREPSAPSFNVPAYQSNPAAPAAPAAGGPTPAPRTVFVSSRSQTQTLNTAAADVRLMVVY